MPSSRRTVLGLVGGTISGGLAGCTGSNTSSVDLGVSNTTSEKQSLYIEILPASVEEGISENALFAAWFEVGADRSDKSYKQKEKIFAEQKALVRVKTDNGYIGEYTFIPDCPADGKTGEAIEVRLVSPNHIQFSQNSC
ncbi:hypothetical protein [Halorubellus sp. PRR65]|uniref:hypothetical protein n=1 Tax=Halorubellus sp. PRR65 TaxID=3098148 RepID=UPI002B25CE91|nr:hypothetical protein [Halorubellus sp. PRR65]